MRELFGNSWGRLRVPVGGLVIAMLLSMVATTAQAVPSPSAAEGQATTAARAARAPVLNNEFGKLRSRVIGTFGNGGTMKGTFKGRDVPRSSIASAVWVKTDGRWLEAYYQETPLEVK